MWYFNYYYYKYKRLLSIAGWLWMHNRKPIYYFQLHAQNKQSKAKKGHCVSPETNMYIINSLSLVVGWQPDVDAAW